MPVCECFEPEGNPKMGWLGANLRVCVRGMEDQCFMDCMGGTILMLQSRRAIPERADGANWRGSDGAQFEVT